MTPDMRRLLLFDIDGTLVSGGPAKQAFHSALLEVFGTAGPIERWEFSGKTDPQIARELLTAAGLAPEVIDDGFPQLWGRYLSQMQSLLPESPLTPLPGVVELLGNLRATESVALGLLTGNLARGAALKLESAGLEPTFPVGAYGSDHEQRRELPRIAVERAAAALGVDFRATQVVVVGDTPRDVDCGKWYGARTIAVATGRFDREELDRTGADVVLEDLGDLDRSIEALVH